MYERLVNALGGEGIATVVIAIIVIAVLVILGYVLLAIVRGLTSGGRLGAGRSAAPRVAVLDIVPVDQKRQLVLLRRDEVEHLVLIGGQNDLVVEAGISRIPVRTRRVEPSFTDTPQPPRPEATPVAPPARPVEPPQPVRSEPRPAPAHSPAQAAAPSPAQARPAAPEVSSPLPPRRTEPSLAPSRPQQPPAPRPQPAQPAQPRSMATPTLPQRPAAYPIEAAEGPRAQQPSPAVTVASGSPAATEVSTVRNGGASPLPGRPSGSQAGAAKPESPASPAGPVAQPATKPAPAPAPAAKAEGSLGPLQVKSFATSVQTHRSDKAAPFPPLGATAGAASAAAATKAAAPETKPVAVEPAKDDTAADGDIDQLLMAELSKEKVDTPPASPVADKPSEPGEPVARPEPATKPAQDRPAMMSLEEEMDALLRDFTLDPPEKR
ncbi:hypothetical protein [Aureimonas altamirensis]|uniref:hypothetical protein n=1 Tax=Aureimonas altamirensis TaxID=370622 RepID=UPI00255256CC|nr:hypothetical protein [Aureimonas altamirensis]